MSIYLQGIFNVVIVAAHLLVHALDVSIVTIVVVAHTRLLKGTRYVVPTTLKLIMLKTSSGRR